ncbi:MAG: hypothetical protein ABI592_11515 [Acidobacteriota bacterium]
MKLGRLRSLSLGVVSLVALSASIRAEAPACAATPQDAWTRSREAVASGDAGKVMLALSPAFRTRNSVEYAVGASMTIGMNGMSGATNKAPGAAAKAEASTKKLSAELDAILKKHKAATIQEIGKPLLARMQEPAVLARFEKIDHAAYAREMEKFMARVEAAHKEAGGTPQPAPGLGELVVGGGDMKAALAAPKVTGDTARAAAGKTTMLFRKVDGCWLVDGREESQ